MLLPIRRPVRPQPGPLRERLQSDADKRPDRIWLSVRHKRSRAVTRLKTKFALASRGLVTATTEN
jgi:hypothetical protein